ncbi:MAG: 3'-5' exonuclease [Pseudomonadota bacterium]
MTDDALTACAERLDEHPDFRVIRRYQRPDAYGAPPEDDSTVRTGVYLDTETTGFDEDTCKIIELAMIKFRFTTTGELIDFVDEYDEFNDPGEPIPEDIVALTGITDDMVRGQALVQSDIDAFLDGVAIVIAHNAGFDRRFVEAHLTGFESLAWACSAQQVPWREAGFESRKLEYVAYRQGFFYDGHRAINDCLAGVHMLAQPLPEVGRTGFAHLLRNARGKEQRIYAERSPFETKDALRLRGYRWNNGDNGRPKSWYIDVADADVDAELAWLHENIFKRPVDLPMTPINPFNRFSTRI